MNLIWFRLGNANTFHDDFQNYSYLLAYSFDHHEDNDRRLRDLLPHFHVVPREDSAADCLAESAAYVAASCVAVQLPLRVVVQFHCGLRLEKFSLRNIYVEILIVTSGDRCILIESSPFSRHDSLEHRPHLREKNKTF